MDHCSHVLRLEARGNDGNESGVQWSSVFIVNTFSIVLFYVEMHKKCGNGRGGRTCQKMHAVRKSTRTISTLYQCSTPWFWRPSSACCCGVPLLHGQNCSSVGRSLTLKKNPSERVVAKQPTLWGCRLTRALIPLALRVAEAEGWERSHIQRNVHGAEIESYQRDMHLLQETWNQKRQDLIRKHTDKIRSMTQRPVYFTQSGKCWRSRVTCLQRLSSTPIIGRAYCTHCSHYLGSTMPFANEDDDWSCRWSRGPTHEKTGESWRCGIEMFGAKS